MTSYDRWVKDPSNKELQQQVKEEWQMYYSVKHGGKEGRIKAVNRESAETQFQWLLENKDCFCRTCTHQYVKDYSVYMDSYNNKCVHDFISCVHKEPQVISGIMQG